MLCTDYTTNILGLKDILVTSINENENFLIIYIKSTLTAPLCPCCSSISRIHAYRTQKVKDLNIRGKHVILSLKKKRWKCSCCGKAFFENLIFFLNTIA